MFLFSFGLFFRSIFWYFFMGRFLGSVFMSIIGFTVLWVVYLACYLGDNVAIFLNYVWRFFGSIVV